MNDLVGLETSITKAEDMVGTIVSSATTLGDMIERDRVALLAFDDGSLLDIHYRRYHKQVTVVIPAHISACVGRTIALQNKQLEIIIHQATQMGCRECGVCRMLRVVFERGCPCIGEDKTMCIGCILNMISHHTGGSHINEGGRIECPYCKQPMHRVFTCPVGHPNTDIDGCRWCQVHTKIQESLPPPPQQGETQ